AGMVEQLLAPLDRPQALAQAIRIREQAARALGDWSHARFEAERLSIERLQDRRDLQAAYSTAERLLQRCLNAGEEAYRGAAYDIALAYLVLGRAVSDIGAAEAALQPLAEGRRRFQALADVGDNDAERMAAVAVSDTGLSLRKLGRLDEAASAYEEAIERAEQRQDNRSVAVNNFQLGTVRLWQCRYAEALKIYAQARDIFESLDEPRSIATVWHQIGRVHRQAGQLELAERAYRQSLMIEVQQKNLAGEADSLIELGNLYDDMGRLEEAVTF